MFLIITIRKDDGKQYTTALLIGNEQLHQMVLVVSG